MNDLLDTPLSSPRKTRYFRLWVACIWGGAIAIGSLFRVSHWPFAAELILSGSAGLCAYALSGFLWLRGKDLLNTVFTVASLIWLGWLIWKMLVAEAFPFGGKEFLFYGGVFIPVFVISVLVNSMKERR